MGKTRVWGKTQWADNESDKPSLPPEDIKCIQKVVEEFLYYKISVEPIILVELGTLAVAHSKGIEYTKQSVANLPYYCATNPYAKLIFH